MAAKSYLDEEIVPDRQIPASSHDQIVKVSVNTWVANEIEQGEAVAVASCSSAAEEGASSSFDKDDDEYVDDNEEDEEEHDDEANVTRKLGRSLEHQRHSDEEANGETKAEEEFLKRLQERTGLGVYADTKRRRALFAGKRSGSDSTPNSSKEHNHQHHTTNHQHHHQSGGGDQRRSSTLWDYATMKILDPWERPYYFCLFLSSLAVLYNMFMIIGRVTFDFLEEYVVAWLVLDYVADLIYIFDIAYQSRKGYLQDGILSSDHRIVLKKYLCGWRPLIDIAAVLPTELFVFHPSNTFYTRTIFRFNRLLKTPRLFEWLDRTWRISSYPIIVRLCTLVLYFFICLHWNACVYYEFSKRVGLGADTWVVDPTKLSNDSNSSLSTGMYLSAMYWSAMRLTNIGEVPAPVTDGEMIFTILDMLLAIAVFAGIFGSIEELLERAYERMHTYHRWMDEVKKYMSQHSVPYELQTKIYMWMVHFLNQNHVLGGGTSSLAVLPERLQAEINMNAHLDTLRRVRFFQDCEPGLLVALLNKLTLQMFNPGEYICRKGDVGKEMYIVKSGRLSVVGPDGLAVFATLTEGAVFGELSLLNISGSKTGNRRTASIRSNGFSDLFCLSKEDLWAALQDYPEARRVFIQKGREILIKDGLLDGYVRLDQFALLSQVSQYEQIREKAEHLVVRISAMVVGMGANLRATRYRIRHLERQLEKYREAYRRRKIQLEGDQMNKEMAESGEESP